MTLLRLKSLTFKAELPSLTVIYGETERRGGFGDGSPNTTSALAPV